MTALVVGLLLATTLAPLAAAAELTSRQPADSKEVLASALADAQSDDAARQNRLLGQLRTRSFLETLDSPADYVRASKDGLRVEQIVDALASNPAPGAQRALLALTTEPVFLAHDERTLALIRASALVADPRPALVGFWDKHSRPDDGFTPTTIGTLVANGSRPALALFEKKMLDDAHADDDKTGWMRVDILAHRNDLPVLQSCGRLLRGSELRARLRPLLVEVLFDYRPGEWFRPATVRPAPPLESASPPARRELRAIAEHALKNVPLTPEQRAAVMRRLQEISKLDMGQGVR